MKTSNTGMAVCLLGIFIGLCFGAVSQAAPADKMKFEVRPTIFFIEEKGTLKQKLDIAVDNPGPAISAQLEIKLPKKTLTFKLEKIAAGKSVIPVFIPEVQQASKTGLKGGAGPSARSAAGTFVGVTKRVVLRSRCVRTLAFPIASVERQRGLTL